MPLLLVKTHIAVTHLSATTGPGHRAMNEEFQMPVGAGDDWATSVLRLKEASVLIVVAYLTSSIGSTGANVKNLWQIGNLIKTLGLPTIVIGNMNMTIDQLYETSWPYLHDLVPLRPIGVDATCSNGCRLLEYG